MAFSASGLYVHTFREILRGTTLTGGAIDLRLATYRIALHSNSLTQGAGILNFSSATPNWANTNEVSGTGWAAGGVLLSAVAAGATSAAPTLDESSTAGNIRYDMGDVAVSGTTLTNARGCIIYADPVTAPSDMADAMVVAVTFGADYSTNNGVFGITWNTNGVFEIDLVP